MTVRFPEEGVVHVIVWHPQESVGRYILVVGEREALGGESGFAAKLKEYWKPVQPPPPSAPGQDATSAAETPDAPDNAQQDASTAAGSATARVCTWIERLLAFLTGAEAQCQ